MFYRESGEFKSSYRGDNRTFPMSYDVKIHIFMMLVAIFVIPMVINDYWAGAILLPFMIYSIASIGLNLLTGYSGQVSLGTGAFMAVGAYASYKLMTSFPELNIVFVVLGSGIITAAVGVFFGLPSLRIKGFYLAVATLAAQFFLVWLFNKVGWFYNYSATGQITSPERTLFGFAVTGANATTEVRYLFCLAFVVVLGWAAKNLTRGKIGRSWMAIRDMDIAAEIIGVNPMMAKMSAFAVSSFYVGISGSLLFTVFYGAIEVTEVFGIERSFLILFMIIIGGLGSLLGSFIGAAFMVIMPVLLKNILVTGLGWPTDVATHFEFMIVGALIIIFLIAEPDGLAKLWGLAKQKLRLWPFPH
jgi:branched-chain amino acid transport system permease protein